MTPFTLTAWEKKSLELNSIIVRRTRQVLKDFAIVAVNGVTNSELLAILQEVISYWKDKSRLALISFSCEAVGGKPEIVDNVSLMFTLGCAGIGIHDDIIDRTNRKHYRNTILGLYNSEKALLAGDLLITKSLIAIEKIIKEKNHHFPLLEVINTFYNFSLEICEAELSEMSFRKKLGVVLDDYILMLKKTSADTAACCKFGAILGNGNKEEILSLEDFGRRFGFMFRLIDDVKDSLNRELMLSHRLKNESYPLPLHYAANFSAKNKLELEKIIKKNPLDISAIANICYESDAFDYIKKVAEQNVIVAKEKLKNLRKSTENQIKAQEFLELMINLAQKELLNQCQK